MRATVGTMESSDRDMRRSMAIEEGSERATEVHSNRDKRLDSVPALPFELDQDSAEHLAILQAASKSGTFLRGAHGAVSLKIMISENQPILIAGAASCKLGSTEKVNPTMRAAGASPGSPRVSAGMINQFGPLRTPSGVVQKLAQTITPKPSNG